MVQNHSITPLATSLHLLPLLPTWAHIIVSALRMSSEIPHQFQNFCGKVSLAGVPQPENH